MSKKLKRSTELIKVDPLELVKVQGIIQQATLDVAKISSSKYVLNIVKLFSEFLENANSKVEGVSSLIKTNEEVLEEKDELISINVKLNQDIERLQKEIFESKQLLDLPINLEDIQF